MASSLKSIFRNPRLLIVFFLGFSSGLPLMLTAGGSTMQAWLKDGKIDLAIIGRFALIGLPYAIKFLWAPLLDSYAPPFLGRRRGWGLITQIGLVLALLALAFSDPTENLTRFAIVALCVSFFSASQDIVLDALRTEMLSADEIGPGGSVYLTGYRLAMLMAGAVALALSERMPWTQVYLLMTSLMAIGIVALLLAKEPVRVKVESDSPRGLSLRSRVFDPFTEFFKRPSAMEILLFVMLYKLPTLMATALTTVFLLETGFQKVEIAAVTKVVGLVMTLVGTLAGGALIAKLGLRFSLWIFGFAQALGGALFILLAIVGKNQWLMATVIGADNFLMGLGTAAIVGFMMSVCSKHFTGTQYALLSSLTAFTRVILIAPAGTLAKHLGWPTFFIFSVVLALPGLLLLSRYERWNRESLAPMRQRLHPVDVAVIAVFMLSLVVISTDFVWPMLGLPDVALWVGGVGLLLAVGSWAAKEFFMAGDRVSFDG